MQNPSDADLAAIEAEWPSIAAGVAETAEECVWARVPIEVLARRAQRRAVRRLLAVLAAADSTSVPVAPASVLDLEVAGAGSAPRCVEGN